MRKLFLRSIVALSVLFFVGCGRPLLIQAADAPAIPRPEITCLEDLFSPDWAPRDGAEASHMVVDPYSVDTFADNSGPRVLALLGILDNTNPDSVFQGAVVAMLGEDKVISVIGIFYKDGAQFFYRLNKETGKYDAWGKQYPKGVSPKLKTRTIATSTPRPVVNHPRDFKASGDWEPVGTKQMRVYDPVLQEKCSGVNGEGIMALYIVLVPKKPAMTKYAAGYMYFREGDKDPIVFGLVYDDGVEFVFRRDANGDNYHLWCQREKPVNKVAHDNRKKRNNAI